MSAQAASVENHEAVDNIRCVLEKRIEQGGLDLPLLPRVASEVISLSSDPNANASKLTELIHQDMALAGHILKVANCPVYMPRSPIVSLQQGIAWLGMNNLALIALTISMKNGAFQVEGYTSELKQVWKHASASALYAKEIARVGRHNVESAFLCGLLHTIGQPAILREVIKLRTECGISLNWEETYALMQEYQVLVGNMIADKWTLPDQVKEAISHYSDYSPESSPSKMSMITCLSDHLATHLLDPDTTDEQSVRDRPVIQDLNLYPEDLDTLFEKRDMVLEGSNVMAG